MAAAEGFFIRTPGVPLKEATATLGKNWRWQFAAGFAYIILGIIAISIPLATTVGLNYAIAAFLVASGILHLVQAVRLRHEQGSGIRFLQSFLSLFIGAVMLWLPGLGMMGMTILLSIYFLVSSGMQGALGSAMARGAARFWIYLSAFTSFALAIFIITTFPLSAIWLPGTLLGIEFVLIGTSLLGFSLTVRRLYRISQGLDKSTDISGMSYGHKS